MSDKPANLLALLAVSLAVFVAALDLTVTAAVLPQLIFDFEIPLPGGLADAAWIVNGYLIAYVVTMPVMGRVSDLFGRRLVFLVCLALFVAGSLWAGLAESLWPMVAARVVQALGGGAMVPVALAAVSDAVPARQRPLAIGFISAVDTAGWVAGPAYGAWLTTWLGWRWVFWLNIPLGILAAILVAVGMKESARERHRLDIGGALLLTLFLLSFTMALYLGAPASPESGMITQGAVEQSPWMWPLLAASALLLAAFAAWERQATEPLIDLRLLARRAFAAANSVNLLTGVILMAVMVEVPVLLQAVSPSVEAATAESGRLLAAFAGGMVLGSLLAGPLLRALAPRWVVLGGLAAMVAGLWQMAAWEAGTAVSSLLLPLTLAGLGLGFVTTPLATSVLEQVNEAERGIAASILLVARLIGMTLGLSVLVTWALRRFDTLVAQVPPPPGGLFDPNAAAYLAEKAVEVTTTVVTDLFLVTAIIALLALLPALFVSSSTAPRKQGKRTPLN